MPEEFELFSQAWCDAATPLWEKYVVPNLVDPASYNYAVEFAATDQPQQLCQLQAHGGQLEWWNAGKKLSDDELTFIIWATRANWQKVCNGSLDPVGGVAAKRIHMKKGPMTVVVQEAEAFTQLLKALKHVPTDWS